MLILVLNSGSSSVKFQLYDMPKETPLANGIVEKIGDADSFLRYQAKNRRLIEHKIKISSHNLAVKLIIQYLRDPSRGVISSTAEIKAIGHRVVHGGERFKESTLISQRVLKAIKSCSKRAPLHNPPNLAGIYACKQLFPACAQVAVFDTAFHQTMPRHVYLYGLPYSAYKRYGIRRYGFHGTSHRYVAQKASTILGKPLRSLKIITCHLGNGCSITAVNKGSSYDTSMGFTPLEGLVMGTRCGDIDPAAVLYLMKREHLSISQADQLLNKRSGLLGLSQKSNDMRDILALMRKGDEKARLALSVFIYRIKKYIGAYFVAMGGCDAIVFTAGIGENAGYIRREIKRGLSPLINTFKIRILVIRTSEELMIAKDTYKIIKRGCK